MILSHHSHRHDRGLKAFFRYLRLVPQLWSSDVGREVVRELALRPGERVIDLGAGMGSAAVLAVRSGAAVIAIDPTSYMRWVLRARSLGTLRVLDGAAEAIPLEDASADALWTVNTIHHWTDRAGACREMARVLRPKGRMLLVDEDFTDPAHPEHRAHAERRKREGLVRGAAGEAGPSGPLTDGVGLNPAVLGAPGASPAPVQQTYGPNDVFSHFPLQQRY